MNLSITALIAVGGGGFLGALLRYLISGWVTVSFRDIQAPLGIAIVNISGCLLIGACAAFFEIREWSDQHLRLFIFTGLLGGYTTFSTYIFDSLLLGKEGEILLAILNAGGQVVTGLLCAWLGYQLVRMLF